MNRAKICVNYIHTKNFNNYSVHWTQFICILWTSKTEFFFRCRSVKISPKTIDSLPCKNFIIFAIIFSESYCQLPELNVMLIQKFDLKKKRNLIWTTFNSFEIVQQVHGNRTHKLKLKSNLKQNLFVKKKRKKKKNQTTTNKQCNRNF